MENTELINLVTTNLIQEKRELEYELKNLINKKYDKRNIITLVKTKLREYREIINDIQLWESLINEATNTNQEGDNNK